MRETRLRFPALIAGIVLVVFFCAFTPYNNVKLQNSPLAGGHFPLASFGSLFLLVALVNPVLSLFKKTWRFNLHEILLIWSMVAVATGIAYTGFMRTFIINITTPEWFSCAASHPVGSLLHLLPSGLFPKDPNVVGTLYSGLEGGLDMSWWEILTRIPWTVWIVPVLLWSVFIALVYMAMVGVVGIFSHQWIENEKMNFPLLQVPQTISEEEDKGDLLDYVTNKYFVIGFLIPVALHLLNGLHTYYPQVPQIPTLILAQPYVPKEGIFSGFYKAKIYIYPAFIGFAFLASKQVSFSFWSFFILAGYLPGILQLLGWRIPAAALGTTFGPGVSRVEEMQMIGAFAIFFLFILWLARNHLKLTIFSLFGRDETNGHLKGFLSPRNALLMFLAGFLGVTIWLIFAGMDPISAILLLFVGFMYQIVASRLICQGGIPFFTLPLAPTDGFLAFLNTRIIAPTSLYMGAVVQKVTFLDLRESLMPSLFLSSKLSDGSHPQRRFLGGVILAIMIGLVVSFIAMLALYYKFGINTIPDEWALETSRQVHENVAQLLSHPEGPKEWSMIFTMVGAGVMLLLVLGYHRFIWWPLHPIGYLTAYTSAMQILWFGFFVGWLCSTLVLRYGGANLFRDAKRFFIGLIAGDLVMAIAWLIVGAFTRVIYHVLPL